MLKFLVSLASLSALMAAPAFAQNASPAAGKAAFQRCAMCHSVVPGQARLGPSLSGVVGRKAGGAAGYKYSPAMAKAAFAWDARRLDAFMAKPSAVVPGTKMAYPGISDPVKRAAILAYLRTLRAK